MTEFKRITFCKQTNEDKVRKKRQFRPIVDGIQSHLCGDCADCENMHRNNRQHQTIDWHIYSNVKLYELFFPFYFCSLALNCACIFEIIVVLLFRCCFSHSLWWPIDEKNPPFDNSSNLMGGCVLNLKRTRWSENDEKRWIKYINILPNSQCEWWLEIVLMMSNGIHLARILCHRVSNSNKSVRLNKNETMGHRKT